MSNPIPKAEMHEAVYDYVHSFTGQIQDAPYIHEQIDHPEKRDEQFDLFMEYLTE